MPAEGAQPAESARPRVLLVEDDETIRRLVTLLLLDDGFDVVTAPDGKVGLTRAAEYPPDVILLDMDMPVVNGWQFADAYRATPGPHAPIVVFTASGRSATASEAVGAAATVDKPFDAQRLSEIVRALARTAQRGEPAG